MKDCHIHLKGDYRVERIDKIVEESIKMNLDELWLLDHTYYFKEFIPMYGFLGEKNESWFSKKRDTSISISLYHDFINEIRSKSYPIVVKFGLEVCYRKDNEEFIRKMKNNFDYDFLIGSIHYVGDFSFGRRMFIDLYESIDIDQLYKDYFSSTIDLIKSGLFDMVAHPDLIKKFGYKASYDLIPYYTDVAKNASLYNVALEHNSGINRGDESIELGMNDKFLEIATLNGVIINTSSDAHEDQDIGYKIEYMNRQVEEMK